MGGQKKPTIKQLSKRQARGEQPRKSRRTVNIVEASKDKKVIGILLPDVKSKKVLSTLKTMRVLTPSTVASRFNLRLSVAKELLVELQRRKLVEYVSGGRNLKIYKNLDDAPKN